MVAEDFTLVTDAGEAAACCGTNGRLLFQLLSMNEAFQTRAVDDAGPVGTILDQMELYERFELSQEAEPLLVEACAHDVGHVGPGMSGSSTVVMLVETREPVE